MMLILENNWIFNRKQGIKRPLFSSRDEENKLVKARNETKQSLAELPGFTSKTGKSPRIIVVVLCFSRKKLFLPEPLFNYKIQSVLL